MDAYYHLEHASQTGRFWLQSEENFPLTIAETILINFSLFNWLLGRLMYLS